MTINPKVRGDLRYVQDPDDETHYTVKDPLRATFHRFNALQVEMMRKLDGRRGFVEVAAEISEEIGSEISEDSLERFVKRLEQSYLLDVSAYRSPPRVHQRVRRVFRAHGIVRHRPSPDDPPPSEEALFMEEGLRQVETGDPCLAASWFTAVLELNPENSTARFALDTIHSIFFRHHRLIPGYAIMFPLFDADRFLGWLDRKLGRWVFSPLALVVAVVAVVVAGYAAWDLKPPEVGPSDIVIAWVSGSLIWLALHELAHGFACKHYGGKVDEAGVILMYGINYGAYVDISDSYFFEDKRHKILTSLAGPYATLLIVCFLVTYVHVTPDGFPLRAVAFTQALVNLFALGQNLIPLVKFDAYYALCDWLALPNLRERSFRHVAVVLQRSLLAIPADDPEPTPRERWIFSVYAVSAAVFTTFYIFGLIFRLLLPLAEEYLGTVGLIIAGLYVVYVLKSVIISPAIAFVRFAWRNRQHLARSRRPAAVLLAGVLAALALLYPWPLLIDGEAHLVAASRAPIYARTSGIIESIAVREGDVVRAGDVLARLLNPDLEYARASAQEQLAAARLQLELLREGARPEELEVARLRTRRASLAFAFEQRVARRAAALEEAGILSTSDSEDALRRSVASLGKSRVAKHSLAELEAGHRPEEIAAAEAEVEWWEAALEDFDRRLGELVLRAPSDGRIVGPRLRERLHENMEEGELFCEVHDTSRVRVEIHLPASEPVSDVTAGSRLIARAWGHPKVEIAAVVDRIAPKASNDARRSTVVQSIAVSAGDWMSGSTGQGRIYGEPRSLMYQLLVRPLIRFFGYETWRFWG